MPCITPFSVLPVQPGARPMHQHLDALPVELQHMVLDALPDQDDLGRMAATSRYWRVLIDARLPARARTAQGAFDLGHRHALARALNTPRDVAPFATELRDHDGMTFLMHAARKNDRAMLRCLVRHGALEQQQRDIYGLTARDWAILHGHGYTFDQDVERAAGRVIGAGVVHYGAFDLHQAIRLGHGQLTAALLGSYSQANNPFQRPMLRRSYTQSMPLTCGLSVLLCAAQHASPQRPVLDVVLATLADGYDTPLRD